MAPWKSASFPYDLILEIPYDLKVENNRYRLGLRIGAEVTTGIPFSAYFSFAQWMLVDVWSSLYNLVLKEILNPRFPFHRSNPLHI